jgi:uncharacterized protein (TIGR03067 family)
MVLGHTVDVLGGEEVDHAKYRLDATKSPKTIDIRHEDGRLERGIYEIRGESLVICSANPGTKQRPIAFESTPESKTTLLTLEVVPAPYSDHQRIQGTWQLTSKLDDGEPIEESKWKANPTTFVFQGNKLTKNDGTEKLDTDFYLDHNWNHILLIDEEWKLTLGYYEFVGGTLRINLSNNKYLPTSSLDSTPDAGSIVLTLRRVKETETDQQRLQGPCLHSRKEIK